MRNILLCVVFSMFAIESVEANVYCSNVEAKFDTAKTASYHNFSELGVQGSVVFIRASKANCTASGSETLEDSIFIVIDSIDNPSGIKKLWLSMLLSADARGETISISASNLGKNSIGYQVLAPYRLMVN